MKSKAELLDVVELREPRGAEPAGAVGAVVEVFSTEALVELADEHGRTVEVLTAPYEALLIREPQPPGRRATG